jgi:rhodanese-related sulfurtransferase
MKSITVTALKQWLSIIPARKYPPGISGHRPGRYTPGRDSRGLAPRPLLLDVRESEEFDFCHLDGSLHIPVTEMVTRWHELDPTRDHVVICHHGVRSFQVAQFLEAQGFERVINLTDGLDAWSREVDPSLPR